MIMSDVTTPFQHSKKVPQLYKVASRILQSVQNGGNLKELLSKQKFTNVKALNKLIGYALENGTLLSRLLCKTKVLDTDRLQESLARILIAELVWGKGTLGGDSKPVVTVRSKKEEILKELALTGVPTDSKPCRNKDQLRYVRVNTLKITTEDVVQTFKEAGWEEIPCPDTYEDFLRTLKERLFTEKNVFVRDFHVKDMLVFPNHSISTFSNYPDYIENNIVLQNKASCLATCYFRPAPGSVLMDMCAAPGMKTSLFAAIMQNKGKIYAIDQDTRRFKTMQKLLPDFGVTCAKLINDDVGNIGPEKCKDVNYIVVDPSCSGVGIMSRIEDNCKQPEEAVEMRLQRLAQVQSFLLRHAVSNFPSAEMVIYYTCSLHPEENEAVVQSVLSCATLNGFSLVDLSKHLSGWKNFGSPDYKFGHRCIYSRPDTDFTNGGFLAIFKRTLKKTCAVVPPLSAAGAEDQEKRPELSEQFFARINTLKVEVNDVIQQFVDRGWSKRPSPENKQLFISTQHDPEVVNEQIFTQDHHINELLHFPAGNMKDSLPAKLVKMKKLILQDKASCLAAHFLNPPPGSTVLNISAGRDKSTAFIAARMKNRGTIYAYEPNPQIRDKLVADLEAEGVTCAKVILDSGMNSNNVNCPDVEYVLVSPPTTVSGVVEGGISREDKKALLKDRTGRQFSLLRHALSEFPQAKGVVYSTNSVNPKENEGIVNALQVFAKFRGFQLTSCREHLQGWNNASQPAYICGTKCLIAKDESDITKGVFVAVFHRMWTDWTRKRSVPFEEEAVTTVEPVKKKKKKLTHKRGDDADEMLNEITAERGDEKQNTSINGCKSVLETKKEKKKIKT